MRASLRSDRNAALRRSDAMGHCANSVRHCVQPSRHQMADVDVAGMLPHRSINKTTAARQKRPCLGKPAYRKKYAKRASRLRRAQRNVTNVDRLDVGWLVRAGARLKLQE